MKTQVIYIQPHAPRKPEEGAACNGCGVCCLSEPCPLGMLLFRKRTGACPALRWEARERRYRCAAVSQPHTLVSTLLPGPLQGAAPLLAWLLRYLAPRWVAAGQGCDSNVQAATVVQAQAEQDETQRSGEKP